MRSSQSFSATGCHSFAYLSHFARRDPSRRWHWYGNSGVLPRYIRPHIPHHSGSPSQTAVSSHDNRGFCGRFPFSVPASASDPETRRFRPAYNSSREIAGMKFSTRSISPANASSINVPLVKQRKTQSSCFSQRRIRFFAYHRFTAGVNIYINAKLFSLADDVVHKNFFIMNWESPWIHPR